MNELSSTEVFLRHRELLFSIVYNVLGSVADTEDVLQETWLAWSARSGRSDVENPRAYLVRVAVNAALARRTTINRRKEEYIGPWLPEPVVTPIDPVERTEAVSLAVLVVLETLSPLERAVFVLHEVFGYQLAEIAEIIGRTPSAVRRTAARPSGAGACPGPAATVHRGPARPAGGDAAVRRGDRRRRSRRTDGGPGTGCHVVGRRRWQGPRRRTAARAGQGPDRAAHHRRSAPPAGALARHPVPDRERRSVGVAAVR